MRCQCHGAPRRRAIKQSEQAQRVAVHQFNINLQHIKYTRAVRHDTAGHVSSI